MTCQKIPSEEFDSEECDCSVYNKLIRKCYCLNQPEYNDFVIQFNENTRYTTSDTGEVIKNVRILKRFMYMSCTYTKNTLMFLIDGLSKSKQNDKVKIVEGCSYADICNIFEEHSIVTVCILWPWRFLNYGDCVIQVQAATLLLKLAELEEGRKYLNLNSKIASDIRKITKKRSSHLEPKTIEHLNATMGLLKPIPLKHSNVISSKTSDDTGSIKKEASIYPYNRNVMICKAQNTYVVKRPKIVPTFTD